jgi:hypothetical protein
MEEDEVRWMKIDNITEIGIDDIGRLYIKPENKKFTMIWRSATEVHWDEKDNFLYSPKPREWTYLMWYKQIASAILNEYGCKLIITPDTRWISVPDDLKLQILLFNSTFL